MQHVGTDKIIRTFIVTDRSTGESRVSKSLNLFNDFVSYGMCVNTLEAWGETEFEINGQCFLVQLMGYNTFLGNEGVA